MAEAPGVVPVIHFSLIFIWAHDDQNRYAISWSCLWSIPAPQLKKDTQASSGQRAGGGKATWQHPGNPLAGADLGHSSSRSFSLREAMHAVCSPGSDLRDGSLLGGMPDKGARPSAWQPCTDHLGSLACKTEKYTPILSELF